MKNVLLLSGKPTNVVVMKTLLVLTKFLVMNLPISMLIGKLLTAALMLVKTGTIHVNMILVNGLMNHSVVM